MIPDITYPHFGEARKPLETRLRAFHAAMLAREQQLLEQDLDNQRDYPGDAIGHFRLNDYRNLLHLVADNISLLLDGKEHEGV